MAGVDRFDQLISYYQVSHMQ